MEPATQMKAFSSGYHVFLCDLHPDENGPFDNGIRICENPDRDHEGRCYCDWTNPPWNIEKHCRGERIKSANEKAAEGFRLLFDGAQERLVAEG